MTERDYEYVDGRSPIEKRLDALEIEVARLRKRIPDPNDLRLLVKHAEMNLRWLGPVTDPHIQAVREAAARLRATPEVKDE